jgi:hypothetical protein
MPARPEGRLAWQNIGEQGVVLDLDAQRAYGLNPSGTFLWELVAERDEDGLAAALVTRYGLSPAAARADVAAFLADLRRRGLLLPEAR